MTGRGARHAGLADCLGRMSSDSGTAPSDAPPSDAPAERTPGKESSRSASRKASAVKVSKRASARAGHRVRVGRVNTTADMSSQALIRQPSPDDAEPAKWVYEAAQFTPCYDLLLSRHAELSKHRQDDPLVFFAFSTASALPVAVHRSRLLLAGGPLAALGSAELLEQRPKTVTTLPESDTAEVFSIAIKYLYLEKIDLCNEPPSVVVSLCSAADRWCLDELFRLAVLHLSRVLVGCSVETLIAAAPMIESVHAIPTFLRLGFATSVANRFGEIMEASKALEANNWEESMRLTTATPDASARDSAAPKVTEPDNETDVTVTEFVPAKDQRGKAGALAGIWSAFTTSMMSCLIEKLSREDAHAEDLIRVVLTYFESGVSDSELLQLLKGCRWDLISPSALFGDDDYSANWSKRALRMAAQSAAAAGSGAFDDRRVSLSPRFPFVEIRSQSRKGAMV